MLDEEVNRLPAKYREPFVLRYLEGRTNEQVAREAFRSATKGLSFMLGRCRKRDGPSDNTEVLTGVYRLDEIDPMAYRYRLVVVEHMTLNERNMSESVFVINDRPTI